MPGASIMRALLVQSVIHQHLQRDGPQPRAADADTVPQRWPWHPRHAVGSAPCGSVVSHDKDDVVEGHLTVRRHFGPHFGAGAEDRLPKASATTVHRPRFLMLVSSGRMALI